MPRSLPVELRQRIVDAHREGGSTYAELAKRFSVGEATVNRWLALARLGEPLAGKPHGGHRWHKVGDEERASLLQWVAERPDLTLEELRKLLAASGVNVSVSTVHRQLRALGLTLKKSPSSHHNGRRRG
jgi:transposase